jgi:hypothetical protein
VLNGIATAVLIAVIFTRRFLTRRAFPTRVAHSWSDRELTAIYRKGIEGQSRFFGKDSLLRRRPDL